MNAPARGNLLDRPITDAESTRFAREYALECVDKGAEPDPRLRNLRRRTYRSRLAAQMEFEALVNDEGRVEVAGVWIDRRWIADKAQLPMAITAWARFLEDALGTLSLKDEESVGNALAVSYEIATTFRALLGMFPFVPRDGVGAATEVFLGRRMDASATVMNRGATVVFRNDPSGRLYTGIALQGTYFELGALLFHNTTTFRKGDQSGVVGWKTPEVEETPFGRRFGLDLDRAAPPQGRIARRYYGFARIPRTAKVEVMLEPTRGLAGVLLRIDQEWMEQSDRNYFAALELLSAFISEGIGDHPDARTKMEIAQFMSCSNDDADLFKVVHESLPFVLKGEMGDGTAVFLGEEETAVAWLDEDRCALVLHENADGWLDCLFHVTEFAEILGPPAAKKPAKK